MVKTCPTCGGECKLVQDGEVQTYRCTSCDNIYKVRRGEQSFEGFSSKSTNGNFAARSAAGVADMPKSGAVNVPQGGAADIARSGAVKVPQGGTANNVPRTGASRSPAEKRELSGEEIFARCIDSVAEVRARRGNTVFSGSAYAIKNGYAITNAHVVAEGGKPAEKIEMYACGRKFTAEIVALGSRYPEKEDLALLRLKCAPEAFRPVRFADSAALKNGQTVYVIGNSLGGGTCITAGIISDRRRQVEGKQRLMTDCAVNRGNSGGPVFDAYGLVVGTVVSVTTSAEGMNYAIPADAVKKFISRTEI